MFTLRRSLRTLLVVLAALVAGITSVAPAARADGPSDEQAFVDAINTTRAGIGLPPLTVHPELVDVARRWAEQMKSSSAAVNSGDCLISHNPGLRNAVQAAWKKLGENVGCGDVGVAGLHTAFVNSPKHYANIVDPQFKHVGIGIVYDGDVMFVTEQFMDLQPASTTSSTPSQLALAPKASRAKVLSASNRRTTKTTRKRV